MLADDGSRLGMAAPAGVLTVLCWFLLLLVAGPWGRASCGVIIAQYPGPADSPLQFSHLAVDKKTGYLYAAAKNRLLQLDPDLR